MFIQLFIIFLNVFHETTCVFILKQLFATGSVNIRNNNLDYVSPIIRRYSLCLRRIVVNVANSCLNSYIYKNTICVEFLQKFGFSLFLAQSIT